jgi:hypothetical protein
LSYKDRQGRWAGQTLRWQIYTAPEICDGETLAAKMVDPQDSNKIWLIFITPRIIDAAGNPAHTDAEISSKH